MDKKFSVNNGKFGQSAEKSKLNMSELRSRKPTDSTESKNNVSIFANVVQMPK